MGKRQGNHSYTGIRSWVYLSASKGGESKRSNMGEKKGDKTAAGLKVGKYGYVTSGNENFGAQQKKKKKTTGLVRRD